MNTENTNSLVVDKLREMGVSGADDISDMVNEVVAGSEYLVNEYLAIADKPKPNEVEYLTQKILDQWALNASFKGPVPEFVEHVAQVANLSTDAVGNALRCQVKMLLEQAREPMDIDENDTSHSWLVSQ